MSAPPATCDPVEVAAAPRTGGAGSALDAEPASGAGRASPAPASPRRFQFARSGTDRVLLGVAGGLGRRLGVDPLLLRLGFASLVAAGGLGVLLYLVAWGVSLPASVGPETPPRWLPRTRQLLATGCVVVGLLMIARDLGLWFGDAVVWPLALAAGGSALIWGRGDEGGPPASSGAGRMATNPLATVLAARSSPLRLGIGALLVAAGMGLFLSINQTGSPPQAAALAVGVTAVGLGLILGPWIARLTREAAEERRQRIRTEERAEIAAHLHDSVLHTLALIQRSDAPPEVTALARRQERELRAWLGGRPSVEAEQDLRGAVDALATRVEESHRVTVDTVVVGDAPVDDRVRALLLACQEAATNAARHSGAPHVSLYVEADAEAVTAYVRDQGRGFDPAAVPADRRGISESIMGRMRRHGGSAGVTSSPGEGTEVHLRLPRVPG
jgi:signal transduction histidine kinase/phage shock protein PspC (stress-responsive transcriptional regulator)